MPIRTRVWLAEPGEGLPEAERHRRRNLTWAQITLIVLVCAALVLVYLLDRGNNVQRDLHFTLVIGLLVILLAAFGLNRRGHYRASTLLTLTCAFLGPWGSFFVDSTIQQGDFVPLTYLVLSVLLASILVSVRVTVILAGIQLGLFLLLPHFVPAVASFEWPSFMAFFFFASLLGIVYNIITRQSLRQIDQQTHLLFESETRLRELSVRDSLTGLFNRRYMEETLDRELNRSERKQLPLGIIMLDLDHFKHINDTYGHAAGDTVLHYLGASLQAHIRGSDIACRYGGDEFILILPEASLEVTWERAERLCLDAKDLNVLYNGLLLETVSLSLGVAVFPDHGSTRLPLLAAADTSLYRAKIEGRNRVVAARDVKQED